jgi:LysM repeat protein
VHHTPVQQTPVQQTPVQQTPIQTGGGHSTSHVELDNHDRNSSIRLHSDRGTSLYIFGDPHVRTVVNGVSHSFDIGYGPGSITLRDGTRITWDTYKNASRALHDFHIDAPGGGRDNDVSTADGHDVNNQLTNLTDEQLREFITKLSEYRGSWSEPLRHRPGSGIDTSPNPSGHARQEHVVKRGDTLWAIANAAGLSVAEVARFNGIRNPNLIYPGQVIKLPG